MEIRMSYYKTYYSMGFGFLVEPNIHEGFRMTESAYRSYLRYDQKSDIRVVIYQDELVWMTKEQASIHKLKEVSVPKGLRHSDISVVSEVS